MPCKISQLEMDASAIARARERDFDAIEATLLAALQIIAASEMPSHARDVARRALKAVGVKLAPRASAD